MFDFYFFSLFNPIAYGISDYVAPMAGASEGPLEI